jgi:hypothetical protein
MKIKFLLIALILGLLSSLSAQEVSIEMAEKVAKNFFFQNFNKNQVVKYQDIKPSLVQSQSKEGENTFYAFNINKDMGFVLVSAQKSTKPVLAYAFKGEFNHDNMHPGQKDMLDWYNQQIGYAAKQKLQAENDIIQKWNDLLNYNPEISAPEKNTREIEPLMMIEWNQGWPYNAACPEDAAGINGHVPVGCVATAMVQVMKYWDYPSTGTGSYTHSSWWNGGYGNITVNFGSKTYEWDKMPLTANGENDELAEINFHAGVAVRMQWGPTGSGANTYRVVDALEEYFRYDPACDIINKDDYVSEATYTAILREQLDNKQPMVYSGSPSSGAGHAWNVDGYRDDEFHMNWGWGGAGNGYYTLDNLISSATTGGEENNFKYDQKAVINIYPADNYPENCSGTKEIVYHQGSFGDGSGTNEYNNNLDCEYIISPECGNIVQLNFDQFELGDGDLINIFNGNTTSAPLLGSFDASNPPEESIKAEYGSMLIQFQTDGTDSGNGWYASFNTDYCSSSSYYYDESGTITDGSGDCNYKKSTVCFSHIQPAGAEAVRLDFTQFDLAEGLDYVTVYENTTSNILETFDADNIPETIIVNAPKAIVLFFANSDDNVGEGWSLDYQSTESDIEAFDLLHGVMVYPNPTNDQVNLSFSLSEPSTINLHIYDMLGKTLAMNKIDAQTGYQKLSLNQFVNFDHAGIYFVDITVGNTVVTRKISIID